MSPRGRFRMSLDTRPAVTPRPPWLGEGGAAPAVCGHRERVRRPTLVLVDQDVCAAGSSGHSHER